ncbi:hypothetical protein ACC691_36375, partial [Rhizobium johnstonii]|uniref:hypothetical protein n=1 Tax=Rhizobium johnstonii TaxID=3019933 RepID=UPI003F97FDC0
HLIWLPADGAAVGFSGTRGDIEVSYTVVSVIIIAVWMLALAVFGTRGMRVIGSGAQEYRLVADATARVFGGVAIVAFLFKVDLARGYVLISFPLGLIVLVLSRWMWRQWLGVRRRAGDYVSRVLLVGSEASVEAIARVLARNPEAGYL